MQGYMDGYYNIQPKHDYVSPAILNVEMARYPDSHPLIETSTGIVNGLVF